MKKINVDLYCRAEGRRIGTFKAIPGELIGAETLSKNLELDEMDHSERAKYLQGCKNGRQLLCPRCGNNLEYLLGGQAPAEQPYRPQLGRFALQVEPAKKA